MTNHKEILMKRGLQESENDEKLSHGNGRKVIDLVQ